MLQEIISGAHTRCETPKPLNPEVSMTTSYDNIGNVLLMGSSIGCGKHFIISSTILIHKIWACVHGANTVKVSPFSLI